MNMRVRKKGKCAQKAMAGLLVLSMLLSDMSLTVSASERAVAAPDLMSPVLNTVDTAEDDNVTDMDSGSDADTQTTEGDDVSSGGVVLLSDDGAENVAGTVPLGGVDVTVTDPGWYWYSFTAEEAGYYLFGYRTESSTHARVEGIYKSTDVDSEDPDLRKVVVDRYSAYSDLIGWRQMQAGETVYFGVVRRQPDAFADASFQVRLSVSRMSETGCALSEAKVNPIPYGAYVNCKWKRNSYDKAQAALLISDQEEDFAAYAQNCYIYQDRSSYLVGGGCESNGTVRGIVLNESSNMSSTGTFSLDTTNTLILSPDTTYYAALVGFDMTGGGETGFYDGIYVPSLTQDPICFEFVPGKEIAESGVKIADVSYDVGYTRNVEVSIIFANPLGEQIYNPKLLDKDGNQLCTLSESNGIYKGTYTMAEGAETGFIPAYEVREGADGTLIQKKGSEQTVRKLSGNFADQFKNIFTLDAEVTTASLLYQFDTGHSADASFYVRGRYQAKGSEEIKSLDTSISSTYKGTFIYTGSYSGSIPLKNLKENTEYALTLNLYAKSGDSTPLYTQEFAFKTAENKVYTDEDFPDETFRKFIYSKIGEGQELSSVNLEKITYLSLSASNLQSYETNQAVRSIEGVQYLKNLTSLSMREQDIEDISPIAGLSSLASADFSRNQIRTLPDLSGMKALNSLNLEDNRIPVSELAQEKFNSQTWAYIRQQAHRQRGELKFVSADTYYLLSDGTAVFYFEIENYRYGRVESLKAVINGTEYPCGAPRGISSYYGFTVEAAGLEAGSCEIVLSYVESYGGDRLETTVSASVRALELSDLNHSTYYLDGSEASFALQNVYVPLTASAEEVLSVSLADAQGTIVGRGKSISAYSQSISNVLPKAFNGYWPDKFGKALRVNGTVYIGKRGLSGSYDLLIETSEQEYRIPNFAVAGRSKGLVTSCSTASGYDSSSEYYYIRVQGTGLVYDKFYPVLYAQDGSPVTGEAAYVGNDNNSTVCIFRLKKLSGFDLVAGTYCSADFVSTAEDYQIEYDGKLPCRVYLNSSSLNNNSEHGVLSLVYNRKIQEYTLYTYSNVKDGTKYTVSLYPDNNSARDEKAALAQAVVTVKDGRAAVDFRDSAGEFVAIPANKTYYYRIKGAGWSGTYGSVTSGSSVFSANTNRYSAVTNLQRARAGKSLPIGFTVSDNTIYQAGDVLTADLYRYDQNYSQTKVDVEPLTLAAEIDGTTAYFKGAFEFAQDLEPGRYRVRLSGTEELCSYTVYVYGTDTFYQTDQLFYWSCAEEDADTGMCPLQDVRLQVGAADAAELEPDKFKLEFFDLNGTEITDIEIQEKTAQGGDLTFVLSDAVTQYGALYCRVTYDGNLGISLLDSGKSYYAQEKESEQYGKFGYLISSPISFSYTTDVGYDKVTSYSVDRYTVSVRDDCTGEEITSFDINGRGRFYFVKKNLQEVLKRDPHLEKLYTLTASADGRTYATARHVNIACRGMEEGGEPDTEPTGIELAVGDKLTMKVGTARPLGAKLIPADAVSDITYTSSDVAVVTVDGSGMLKAVAVGKSVVTATTANGKSASCEVTVNADGDVSGGDTPGGDTPGADTDLSVSFPEGRICTYTGASCKPVIKVTNNGEVLREGTDYTVTYSNNAKAGTAKLTVTGKGSYTGKQEISFTIEPKSLEDDDIEIGTIIIAANTKATPVLFYNGIRLGSKDYTLGGDVGKLSADGSITITGKGNFKDSITVPVKVVEKQKLKKFSVTLGKEKLFYDGTPKQPAITLKDKTDPDRQFVEGEDYRLVFNNAHTDAGTVKVTVIGMGEYSGSVTKSYKILPIKESMTLEFDRTKHYTFNSAGVTVDGIVVKTGKGTVLASGKDYKVSYSANKKAGTGKISISFLGNYKGSKALKDTFTIVPAVLDNDTAKVTVPDKIYTGRKGAYKSTPIVTDAGGSILKSSNYTVAYYADAAMTREIRGKENLIELGEAQDAAVIYVKVTGRGNYGGNTDVYATGSYQVKKTASAVLDISKAKVTFQSGGAAVKKLEYTGRPLEPTAVVTVKVKGVGTVTLDESQYTIVWLNNTNKGKATAVITGNGTAVNGYAFVGSKNASISIVARNLKNVQNLFGESPANLLKKIFAP